MSEKTRRLTGVEFQAVSLAALEQHENFSYDDKPDLTAFKSEFIQNLSDEEIQNITKQYKAKHQLEEKQNQTPDTSGEMSKIITIREIDSEQKNLA